MNKNELVETIAANTGSSKAQAARTITSLTEIITEVLQKGDSISLPGFGTFEVRSRSERTGRNRTRIASANHLVHRAGVQLPQQ